MSEEDEDEEESGDKATINNKDVAECLYNKCWKFGNLTRSLCFAFDFFFVVAQNFDMLDSVLEMEDSICGLSTIIDRSIRDEANIMEAFEKESSYNFAEFFKEDETRNMAIDERLEKMFGNDEVREEEEDNVDKSKTEWREEEEELQVWGIVGITGGTRFGHNQIRVRSAIWSMSLVVQ